MTTSWSFILQLSYYISLYSSYPNASRVSVSHFSVFLEIKYPREYCGIFFSFLSHIAVQQPFRPLWSSSLLYGRELPRASFALCLNALVMLLQPASEDFVSEARSPRHISLSSCGSYPVDLSALGNPTGNNATAGLAVGGAGTRKSLHHGKVVIQFRPSATNVVSSYGP